jgi:hypothetical protein
MRMLWTRGMALCAAIPLLGAILLLGSAARSEVIIFDTFGPGGAYDFLVGSTISGPDNALGPPFAGDTDQGFAFTAPFTGVLSEATVAVGHISGINRIDFSIRSDEGGIPGSVLETFSLENLGTFGAPNVPRTVAVSTAITAGNTYWMTASAPDDGFMAWNLSLDAIGTIAISGDGGENWFVTPASVQAVSLAMELIDVPEPGGATLLLAAVAAFFGVNLSRRYAR